MPRLQAIPPEQATGKAKTLLGKNADLGAAEIAERAARTALIDYLNRLADTQIDFPKVAALTNEIRS